MASWLRLFVLAFGADLVSLACFVAAFLQANPEEELELHDRVETVLMIRTNGK